VRSVERGAQRLLALRVAVAKDACAGDEVRVDLVKRHAKTERILGGVAVQINVTRSPMERSV